MIPALFFKHTSVLVDYDGDQQSITLKKNNITITFYKDQFKVLVVEGKSNKIRNFGDYPF